METYMKTRKLNMKSLLLCILLVISMLATTLTGCGNAGTPNDTSASSEVDSSSELDTSTETETQIPAQIITTILLAIMLVTITLAIPVLPTTTQTTIVIPATPILHQTQVVQALHQISKHQESLFHRFLHTKVEPIILH